MWRDSKPTSSKPIPPPIEPFSPPPLAPLQAGLARRPEASGEGGLSGGAPSVAESGAKHGEGSHLGPSLTVRGDLLAAEDLYFDGKLEGSLSVPNHCAVIGPRAQVKADIDAKEIVVHGNVQGNLRAADRVQIRLSGSVQGDIVTSRIQIDDGANFRGRIEIQRPEAASATPVESGKSQSRSLGTSARSEAAGVRGARAEGSPSTETRHSESAEKAAKSASEL